MIIHIQSSPAPQIHDSFTDPDASVPKTSAVDTLIGVTSADVHKSIGSGVSSKERHHDGQPGRKRNPTGTAGFGSPGVKQNFFGKRGERGESR